MTYEPQVEKRHYSGKAYRSQERWDSYFHQLSLLRSCSPKTILEVGPGEGVVTMKLKAEGVMVTTLDIAPDLLPDVVGSVTTLPFSDNQFDVALCAEVLEHIKFEDVSTALRELARVSKTHVVIGLPHPGYVFSFSCKVPLLPRFSFFAQIPFFWKTHVFNGEHYWELGKKGYPVSRFIQTAKDAGLALVSLSKYADDPAHRFFLFTRA